MTDVLARDPAALIDRLAAVQPGIDPGRARVVRAPGRVNLIGEHTDYNLGFVLPVAIDLGISIALVPTDDRRVELTLADTRERDGFDLDALGRRRGRWIDYVAGTAWALAGALAGVGIVLGRGAAKPSREKLDTEAQTHRDTEGI